MKMKKIRRWMTVGLDTESDVIEVPVDANDDEIEAEARVWAFNCIDLGLDVVEKVNCIDWGWDVVEKDEDEEQEEETE